MRSSSVKSILKVPLDLDLISVFIFAGLKVNTQSWMKIVVSKPIQPHYLHVACNKFYPLNCHHFLGFVCFRSLRIFSFVQIKRHLMQMLKQTSSTLMLRLDAC